MHAATGVL